MTDDVRILVVGIGKMGSLHTRAYHRINGFKIAGLSSHNLIEREDLPAQWDNYPKFDDYYQALDELKPDAVSINTWPDTHADYALAALQAGAHVFIEKPLAATVAQAEQIIVQARRLKRKLVVGYILRHHPTWHHFVEIARTLGKPLVMRMNLNQQSHGHGWEIHKHLMDSLSPIVDGGVHYLDMMCLMARARPVKVHAVGVRLSAEIKADMYNYGQLQVVFDDGSIGWYETGWGPMMSKSAAFVKDVIGPAGSVSIEVGQTEPPHGKAAASRKDDKFHTLVTHHADLDSAGNPLRADEFFKIENEPDRSELCQLEQEYFLRAIREDLNLDEHLNDALNSLKIVFAADASVRTGKIIYV